MSKYYNTCDICGANLDPDESCDCIKKAEQEVRQHEDGTTERLLANKGNDR